MNAVGKIKDEAARIQNECQKRALAYSIQASFWGKSNYFLGVPAAIAAAIAGGVAILQVTNAPVIGGILALFVTALTALITFIDPKSKAAEHDEAASRYEGLKNALFILQNIETEIESDPRVLNTSLTQKSEEYSALIFKYPNLTGWALAKASAQQKLNEFDQPQPSSGVDVVSLDNVSECYKFVSKCLDQAVTSVDDITWGARTEYRSEEERSAYKSYTESVERVCQNGNVSYREISSLNNRHYFERSEKLINLSYGYSLGYFDTQNIRVPLVSFIVIDKKIAIMGFYRSSKMAAAVDGGDFLYITNPLMMAFLNDYYQTLWDASHKIKEGEHIDFNTFAQIRKNLLEEDKDGRD